ARAVWCRGATPWAGRQRRKECRACAGTASATLSSAVKSENSEVIWNERASPSWLRRQPGNAVTSPPAKRMRPASGASSPASSPISVVLPAPFGPMTACSSPFGTESEIASEATTPPKRLVRDSISSRASATARSGEQAVDTPAREQHHEQENRTDDDLPIFGHAGKRLFQHQQRHSAGDGPEHRAHAAEHGHDDEIARTRPVHQRRTDEIGVIGKH